MSRPILRWLIILTLLLSVMLVGAQPTFAITSPTVPPIIDLSDYAGTGLRITSNPVGLRAKLSVPSDVTLPSSDTDGCTTYTGCSSVDAIHIAEFMHVKAYCLTVGVQFIRIEDDPQVAKLVAKDMCSGSLPHTDLYSADITDPTWRATYVQNLAGLGPWHAGWTGQASVTDNMIDVYMERDFVTPSCMDAYIYNRVNLVFDLLAQACGAYSPGGGAPETSHFWLATNYGGLNNMNSSGDLGTQGTLAIRAMQIRDAAGNWSNLTSRDAQLVQNLYQWYSPSTLLNPILSDNWRFEWSSGSGFSPDAMDMQICDKRNGQAQCDYSRHHHNYEDQYQNPTNYAFFGLNNDLPTALTIQRASPDNSILRGGNPKLKNSRSYYIRSGNYGAGATNVVWVDVAGLGAGNYTISGQGYSMRGGGAGTAPTCTWPTSTKYECTAAVGTTIENVYIKVAIGANAVNGLSVAAGNNVDSFTRTVYLAP